MEKDLSETELRLYCIMRGDLNAPVGKLMGQAGHAFVSALHQAGKMFGQEIVDSYMTEAQPKIVLKAKNENVLHRALRECEELGLPCYLVTDAGRTVFLEPTVTCLGIGPVMKSQLPKYVAGLQLL